MSAAYIPPVVEFSGLTVVRSCVFEGSSSRVGCAICCEGDDAWRGQPRSAASFPRCISAGESGSHNGSMLTGTATGSHKGSLCPPSARGVSVTFHSCRTRDEVQNLRSSNLVGPASPAMAIRYSPGVPSPCFYNHHCSPD